MSFSKSFIEKTAAVLIAIDCEEIEKLAEQLVNLRKRKGRLFFIGNGGSAGSASHAVNDFRKLCGIESYCVTDNVSELTARINDEGFDSCFSEWLKVSNLCENDAVMVFSVGGGDKEKNISANIVRSLELAQSRRAAIFGIVGKEGGYTKEVSDACVLVPNLYKNLVTPLAESFCVIVWHLLVSHPALQLTAGKWESVSLQL